MKIAVVCANGKAGKLIVQEAVAKGADVTTVVRSENQSEAAKVILKDLFDLTAADLAGFDVVIDAFGAWTPETIGGIPKAVKHLCDVLARTDTRLLVVGGAGSLYVNKEHTLCVADGADFPEAFKPLAAAHDEALKHLRTRTDVISGIRGWRQYTGYYKYPFWRMVHEWKNAEYICINAKEAYAPEEIRDRSICIQMDIGEVLKQFMDSDS